MIATVAVSGYRSLRDVVLPLGRLTVVTGANGVGKSSLYRALRLLAACGRDAVVQAVAREGGLDSTLWAGPEQIGRAVRDGTHAVRGVVRRGPVALRLGVQLDDDGSDLGYALDLGLPQKSASAFGRDPEVKVETIWTGSAPRPSAIAVDRHGAHVRVRDDDGGWAELGRSLRPFESVLTEVVDPLRAPEVLRVREQLRAWRFYDHFRTDAAAPARLPQLGTRTPVLAADGTDVAAAVQTIRELGGGDRFDAAIEEAFPGSRVEVVAEGAQFSLAVQQHGLLRPLGAGELSDGTLRFLLLAAALLSPRPPKLLVVNEPETSLHPDLVLALGSLIVAASRDAQTVVVTHSAPLIDAVRTAAAREGMGDGFTSVELRKSFGETTVGGQEGLLDRPTWHWPAR
ncbi:AAA family ATPase [uncultured Leifsonia sp.]|uniref:AAA family ATPase n=1 Tax=uncultured Leifsonia sp. TaxID=340359 RepID=UPI0025F3976E|nr:AAA family ATPase [uncultured Leifsonia sp.]